jgi:hypothetical protein
MNMGDTRELGHTFGLSEAGFTGIHFGASDILQVQGRGSVEAFSRRSMRVSVQPEGIAGRRSTSQVIEVCRGESVRVLSVGRRINGTRHCSGARRQRVMGPRQMGRLKL